MTPQHDVHELTRAMNRANLRYQWRNQHSLNAEQREQLAALCFEEFGVNWRTDVTEVLP